MTLRSGLRLTDYTSSFYPWIVAFVAFLIRIPFCLAGAGFDADSYLFLVRAIGSRETGDYMPSRGPGYIVPDLIGQVLAPYGWHYLNLFSSAVQAFSIPVFAAILRETNAPSRSALLWLYALLPLNTLGYSDVMVEYSLAVLGILCGWLMFVRGRWIPATLLWGAGAAMRPSQGIFLLAVFLLIGWRLYGIRQALRGLLSASIPLLLLWVIPAYLLTDNWRILISYLPYDFELRKWLIHLTIRFVAPVGMLPLLMVLLHLWKYRQAVLRVTAEKPHHLLGFSVFVVTLILFLRHPYKANYLLLAVPFGLYWLSALPPTSVKLIAALALLQGFVSFPHSPPIGDHRVIGIGTLYADLHDRVAARTKVFHLMNTAPPKSITFVEHKTIWIAMYENRKTKSKRYQWQFSDLGRIYDKKLDSWFVAVVGLDTLREVPQWQRLGYRVRMTDAIYRHFGAKVQESWIGQVERLATGRGI